VHDVAHAALEGVRRPGREREHEVAIGDDADRPCVRAVLLDDDQITDLLATHPPRGVDDRLVWLGRDHASHAKLARVHSTPLCSLARADRQVLAGSPRLCPQIKFDASRRSPLVVARQLDFRVLSRSAGCLRTGSSFMSFFLAPGDPLQPASTIETRGNPRAARVAFARE
jgi:hypothetical protein